jgi:hypothetical protein
MMISICTVTLGALHEFTKIFCQSIVEATTRVSEVILVNPEIAKNETWEERNITFRLISGKSDLFRHDSAPTTVCSQHAYGLHIGINAATNNHVLISDPDIFFYTKIDNLYLSLMQQHNAQFIGISRPDALAQSIGFFPSIMNLFTKKEHLPNKEFLENFMPKIHFETKEDENKITDKYFYPNTLDEYVQLYPNPDGHFETGCSLFAWTKKNNYKWLSFQTPDCNVYYTKYYKSNFKLNCMPNKKVLFHAWNATKSPERIGLFKEAWNHHELI